MKQLIVTAALAAAAIAPSLAHAGLDSANPIHPLLGVALTAGGDKLASAQFQNGVSKDITAGGLVQLYGGIEYHQAGSPLAFQGTLGYHFDNTSASNGSQRFERFPIEAIALYSVAPKFRLGAGARYAMSARFTSSGAGYVGNGDFKSQLGLLLMAEWLITPSAGLQLRYVNETYKLDGASIDGSHGGLGFNYYF